MLSSTGSFNSFGQLANSFPKNSSWPAHSNGFSQAAFNTSSSVGVINELKFATAKTARQSTIILSAFNIVSAAATAAGILYNNYLSAKRSPRKQKEQYVSIIRLLKWMYELNLHRVNIFTCVRGPDVYPFLLSLGISGQGIIFVVSQAQGLDTFFISGCALISQFMWPGM
jgi:hypothetical protein